MPDECAAIIDQLIQRRQEQGITQQQLANMLNVKQAAISRLERKKQLPNLDTLVRLADALGCKVKIIFDD